MIYSNTSGAMSVPIKIIFLDIDGVLNNDDDPYVECGQGFFSTNCVDRLNRITNATGAKIVLSSTWRLGLSLEEVKAFLLEMKVSAECIGMTPNHNDGVSLRGNEIRKWINDNEEFLNKDCYDFKNYVILDDDSDMLYWQRNNFVHTDGYRGLTDINAAHAIQILNK